MNEPTTLSNRLLRVNDIAEASNISRSLTYRLLQTGKIPTVRINRAFRVRHTDLEEFIRRNYEGWIDPSQGNSLFKQLATE